PGRRRACPGPTTRHPPTACLGRPPPTGGHTPGPSPAPGAGLGHRLPPAPAPYPRTPGAVPDGRAAAPGPVAPPPTAAPRGGGSRMNTTTPPPPPVQVPGTVWEPRAS